MRGAASTVGRALPKLCSLGRLDDEEEEYDKGYEEFEQMLEQAQLVEGPCSDFMGCCISSGNRMA